MDAPASKLYGSPCARPPHQQRNLAVITQRCTAPHCHDKADQRLLANTLTAAAAGAELLGCVPVTVHVQQQNVKWRSCCHKATARLRQCMYSRSGCACKSPTHAQHASAGSTTALLVAHSGRLHSRSNNQLAKDSQSCLSSMQQQQQLCSTHHWTGCCVYQGCALLSTTTRSHQLTMLE